MRIAAWNIRHGGSNHRDLATALMAHEPDVIVLGEHRTQKTAPLIEHLRLCGWPHVAASATQAEDNGVAIISRTSLEVRPSPVGEAPFAAWGVEALAGGVSVIGIYAPLERSWGSSPQIQREYWNRLLRLADARQTDPVLLIGDFNTCGREDGPNILPCSDAFERLSALGWADAWRTCNHHENDFSYVQQFNGGSSSWRIDHAFASPMLAATITDCRFSHAEREAGLSDHSMLIVELQ